jgi:hypothetical protein
MGPHTGWILVGLWLALAPAVSAQCFGELLPWNAEPGARHGSAVAVAGDVVVVGAPLATSPGLGQTGAVTVSRRGPAGWVSWALAAPPLLGDGDRFGHAVAIDGTARWIAVGAPSHDAAAVDGGLVALYAWNPILSTYELDDAWPGLAAGGQAGWSVDLDGELLAIGEPYGSGGGGAVELRRRSRADVYEHETSLSGADPAGGFGWSLAVSADRLVVGSPFHDEQEPDVGHVDLYGYDGKTWTHELYLDGGGPFSYEGWAVALEGTELVLGRPATGPLPGTGYAAIHQWTPGSLVFQSGISSDAAGDGTGLAVAVDDARAVIASPGGAGFLGGHLGDDAGFVLLRALEFGLAWSEVAFQHLGAAAPSPGDRFGESVAVAGRWLVVGAPFHDGAGPDAGAAYVYDLSVDGEHGDLGPGLAGTGGVTPTLKTAGVLCQQTGVWTELDDAVPNAVSFFVAGVAPLELPFKGGVMAPLPQFVVGPLPVTTTGESFLRFVWPPGVGAATLVLQVWVQDPGGPAGWSASPGRTLMASGG